MNPDILLGVVAALAGFLLKTSLAFLVCWALSRLADSPARRFLIWLFFLYGMTAYWLWQAKSVLASGQVSVAAGSVFSQPAAAANAFQIPGSWAVPLGLILRAVGAAYLLISCWMLFSHLRKLRQLNWILGFTSQPPAEMQAAFQPLANKLGVGRARLLVLSGASSPATFGWFRPTIVLPDVCLQQDRSELEEILRHELHHVRRWDFAWNGLSVTCRALLFFHPAAWYAVKRMEFERELACDLAAVSDSPQQRARYAECLIHFARLHSTQNSANWGIDFAASSDHLKTRVHFILAGTRKLSAWLVCSRIVCGLALLTGLVWVEPSVAILLTYARHQITQPQNLDMQATPASAAPKMQSARRARPTTAQVSAAKNSAQATLGGTAQAVAFVPEPGMIDPASAPDGAGPKLVHRGAADPRNASTRQTVIPIEDGVGRSVKGGDHDRGQTVQQTATAAAALVKRLSELDRR